MEKSKKEVIISCWQNHERLFGGGTFEIDVQEGAGLNVIPDKAMQAQNHQEKKSMMCQPYF